MFTRLAALSAVVLALTAGPAAAAGQSPAPLLASNYWEGFIDFWTGAFKKQNGVVMAAIGVGIASLFIITRGKWQK
jgi:hypothetical protein